MKIRITFQTVTPESAEQGDYADQGWIDEEGVSFDTLKEAVDWLEDKGYLEASSHPHSLGDWYTQTEGRRDRAYFERGEDTTESYHLVDFKPRAERAVYAALKKRGAVH